MGKSHLRACSRIPDGFDADEIRATFLKNLTPNGWPFQENFSKKGPKFAPPAKKLAGGLTHFARYQRLLSCWDTRSMLQKKP